MYPLIHMYYFNPSICHVLILQVPVKWPKSRDEVWKANIPHTHLAHEKSDQNWMVEKGEKIAFPGGGTHFHYGADKYIASMANVSLHLALLVLPLRMFSDMGVLWDNICVMQVSVHIPSTSNENVFTVFHFHLMVQKFKIIHILFLVH
jgi:hypothetical protein